jgi:hypothetical protein
VRVRDEASVINEEGNQEERDESRESAKNRKLQAQSHNSPWSEFLVTSPVVISVDLNLL